MSGKCDVYADEKPGVKKERKVVCLLEKVVCLLEKVELMDRLHRAVSIASIRHHCGVNE
jgi:hypothetical protein